VERATGVALRFPASLHAAEHYTTCCASEVVTSFRCGRFSQRDVSEEGLVDTFVVAHADGLNYYFNPYLDLARLLKL